MESAYYYAYYLPIGELDVYSTELLLFLPFSLRIYNANVRAPGLDLFLHPKYVGLCVTSVEICMHDVKEPLRMLVDKPYPSRSC